MENAHVNSSLMLLDQLKCSLGLFCAIQDIKLSPEMSLDDVCYISRKELERAREHLAHSSNDDTLLHYSNQFNTFQNGLAQRPAAGAVAEAAAGGDSPLDSIPK